ncbi:DUF4382 domain-containing protein [Saccharicrinis sp. FJH54]|uniref:DUF4382 domain-containing protein n=1 Tax=Saccharicrinis sp. FJH54 TaxID=3344665 RepID=UPI0035D4D688
MFKKTTYWGLALVFMGLSFVSCDKNLENYSPSTSKLKVTLADSPGDYEAVYVDIQGIMVHSVTEADSGWITLPDIQAGIYDLLKLTNGVDTLLGENEIPSGYLSQIRLLLGPDNYLVTDGDSIHMDTPGAQQSGLKLDIDQFLEPDLTYHIVLDFDAAKSVISAGNSGKYILKPVLRTLMEQTTGTLKGRLQPDSVIYAVYAVLNGDSISTFTDTNGEFIIKGLSPEIYSVYIDPGASSGLNDTLLPTVGVDKGIVTDLGLVEISIH